MYKQSDAFVGLSLICVIIARQSACHFFREWHATEGDATTMGATIRIRITAGTVNTRRLSFPLRVD